MLAESRSRVCFTPTSMESRTSLPRTGPGLRLRAYPHRRETPLAGHKTLNYLYYKQAGEWAKRNGADEAFP